MRSLIAKRHNAQHSKHSTKCEYPRRNYRNSLAHNSTLLQRGGTLDELASRHTVYAVQNVSTEACLRGARITV